jgi:signal transduction histidine kinase
VRHQLDFFGTTVFRWTLAFTAIFVSGALLLFLIIYWQSASYLTRAVDEALQVEARLFASEPIPAVISRIERMLEDDPNRLRVRALFDPDGNHLAGNLAAAPADLPAAGVIRDIDVVLNKDPTRMHHRIRATSLKLADGSLMAIGRDVRYADDITDIVSRTLALGTIPAVLLALLGGALLGRSITRRIEGIHGTARKIMAGDLKQRLPVSLHHDDFDKLAVVVNGMLDEIERLVIEAKGVGDDIAHDLRTPLTRLRARLEHAAHDPATAVRVRDALSESIAELDQLLQTVAALLRITEIEQGRRRAGFRRIDIGEIVRAAAELYQPAAADRGLVFTSAIVAAEIEGDRELLFEALNNLLDNAIKYTPSGGRISVTVLSGPQGPTIRVEDTGPGISEAERAAVFRRFYRSDKGRLTPGTGLGLSLVAAIMRLHGFGLTLSASEPGCRFDLKCWPQPQADDILPGRGPSIIPPDQTLMDHATSEPIAMSWGPVGTATAPTIPAGSPAAD